MIAAKPFRRCVFFVTLVTWAASLGQASSANSMDPPIALVNGLVAPACIGASSLDSSCPSAQTLADPGDLPSLKAGVAGVPTYGTCVVPGFDDSCEQWSSFGGGAHRFEAPLRTVASPDGDTVFVAGYRGFYASTFNNLDWFVSAIDLSFYKNATGGTTTTQMRKWTHVENGRMDSIDVAFDIDIAPDGKTVYATGLIYDGRAADDFVTIAYDAATGAEKWRTRFGRDATSTDIAAAIDVSPDGRFVATAGNSWQANTAGYATALLDAATGEPSWVQIEESRPGYANAATDVAVTNDGEVFTTGARWDPAGGTFYGSGTVAYNLTGATLWSAFETQRNSYGRAIVTDGERVYVGGFAWLPSQNSPNAEALAFSYDASTGARLWRDALHGPNGEGTSSWLRAALDPAGDRIAFGGFSNDGPSNADMLTIVVDAETGARVAEDRYGFPGDIMESANEVTFSPDGAKLYTVGYGGYFPVAGGGAIIGLGTVYVGGMLLVRPPSDMLTTATDVASGARLWSARHNFGGTDTAAGTGVVVHPTTGRVTTIGFAYFGSQLHTPQTGASNPHGYTWTATYNG